MPDSQRSDMNIAFFCNAVALLPSRRTLNISAARNKSLEDGIKVLHGFVGAADHHAVSAVNAPDTAAGADVDIVNILLLQLFGASHVIFEHGVAAIDDDVSSVHLAGESHDCLFGWVTGRDHHPHGAGL